jgi:hypothetical protein
MINSWFWRHDEILDTDVEDDTMGEGSHACKSSGSIEMVWYDEE